VLSNIENMLIEIKTLVAQNLSPTKRLALTAGSSGSSLVKEAALVEDLVKQQILPIDSMLNSEYF
jgi:hypothetical protein